MNTLHEAAQQALEALEAMQAYAAAERKGLRICDEAITTLRAALAQEQAEAGHDRSIPPSPYIWASCMAEPAQEHEDWCASVTELLLSCPPRKAPCNCKPAQSPSTPKEKEMTDSNSVFFSLNTGAFPVEMLRLDGSGFHYKGKVIEDAGEAYNLFKQWLAMAHQQAEPVQEPVAWIHTDPDKPRVKFLEWREDAPGYRGRWIKTPLYTAPPRRTMVPLTEDEVYRATKHHGVSKFTAINIARAIEKASWEKNHGQA